MARLISKDESASTFGSGRQRVIETLKDGLSDHYSVVSTFDFITVTGNRVSCDLIVIAPHAVYVLETRDVPGDLVVVSGWLEDGRLSKSPISIVAGKAQALKTWLVSQHQSLKAVWVAGLVVLTREPASLKIALDVRQRVLTLPSLCDHLTDPALVDQRPFAIRNYEKILSKAFRADPQGVI